MLGVQIWEENKVFASGEDRRGRGSNLVGEEKFPIGSVQSQKMSADGLVPEMRTR